jgi:hypothetical protein
LKPSTQLASIATTFSSPSHITTHHPLQQPQQQPQQQPPRHHHQHWPLDPQHADISGSGGEPIRCRELDRSNTEGADISQPNQGGASCSSIVIVVPAFRVAIDILDLLVRSGSALQTRVSSRGPAIAVVCVDASMAMVVVLIQWRHTIVGTEHWLRFTYHLVFEVVSPSSSTPFLLKSATTIHLHSSMSIDQMPNH